MSIGYGILNFYKTNVNLQVLALKERLETESMGTVLGIKPSDTEQ